MPRKTRANSGGDSGAKNGPVVTRRVRVEPAPYSEDEVRDLIFQGYSDDAIARRTGYPLEWVKKQPTPQVGLKAKLIRGARPSSA